MLVKSNSVFIRKVNTEYLGINGKIFLIKNFQIIIEIKVTKFNFHVFATLKKLEYRIKILN